jgi:acetyl esterase/lipase
MEHVLDLSPGGVAGAAIFAGMTALALRPLRSPRRAALASWAVTAAICEVPVLFLLIVAVSTVPDATSGVAWPGGWIALLVAVATSAGLIVVSARARHAPERLESVLDDAFGEAWRDRFGALRRPSWVRTSLWPWPLRPRRIRRARHVRYGPDVGAHLMDLYRLRSTRGPAPVLVHLHGGGFRSGSKNREARALIHHFADHGWICISANYTLARSPAEAFPHAMDDVKRLLAWVHEVGPSHGIDPNRIVLTGSSAGAHLTAMAAVTTHQSRFQAGFEAADIGFAGAIGFYGYYGEVDGSGTSPIGFDASGAPPLLAIHGSQDTYTPIDGAADLVASLRNRGGTAWLAAVPGAQHSFDLFRSYRYAAIVDAAFIFAACVVAS